MAFKIHIEAFGNEITLEKTSYLFKSIVKDFIHRDRLDLTEEEFKELKDLVQSIEEGQRNYNDEIRS